MSPFKAVFLDGVETELLIDFMGNHCDKNHQKMINKKGITDPNQMKLGWKLLLNESLRDPGDWNIHLCNSLNGSQANLDTQRTSDRTHPFRFLDVAESSRKLKSDEVMMDEDINNECVVWQFWLSRVLCGTRPGFSQTSTSCHTGRELLRSRGWSVALQQCDCKQRRPVSDDNSGWSG